MIPVALQPEPPNFFARVQQPGERFLSRNPHLTAKNWNKHNYWVRVIDDLYDAYRSICAYSCHWIPHDTGARTIEHFKPKTKYPQDAYRWSNYRLVCGILNGRKGDHEDILDPFTLPEGWFVIDFPSLLVRPGSHLTEVEANQVDTTIKRLGLNDEGSCLQARRNWLRDYIMVPFPFPYLERRAPFLALELKRQNLIETIGEIMRF